MCRHRNPDPPLPLLAMPTAAAALPAMPPGKPSPLAPMGTRRRRLWDLDRHAHSPLVGVCIPLAALRRMVGKGMGGQPSTVDSELHSGAVAQSRTRNRHVRGLVLAPAQLERLRRASAGA